MVPSAPPSWEELRKTMSALADGEPERCELRVVGRSRAGEPLEMLTVRGGPRSALVMAGPHANEPVGAATLVTLARYVLAHPEVREELTWHLLLSSDPDGGRLNEAWSCSWPVHLEEYHRGLYRPAVGDQPECTFPIAGFSGQLPETRAVMAVIDEVHPVLSVGLHNADTGGAFYLVSRPESGLVDVLASAADRHSIPLEAMPSDCIGLPSPGPGVFVVPEPRGLADRPPAAPGEWQPAGASSMHYAARHGGLGISPEVPVWRTLPIDLPAAASAAYLREAAQVLSRLLERFPARPTVFRPAVEEQVAIMRLMARIADENPADSANQDLSLLVPLRGAGMLLRHAEALLAEGAGAARLRREQAALEDVFRAWYAKAEQALRPVPFELRQLVGYQLDTILGAARLCAAT
ncbi:hypothetical protein KBZ94_27215 [Streptomyces sp. RM72]|nr:hypothetical protein [Streptomyces sp. RM72]